jgi:hypothetical protein
MAKTLLSIHSLRSRALEEIRRQPGCSSVASIAINRVTNDGAKSNWSMCVVSAGAALQVQRALRQDYDLMTDRPQG